MTNTAHHLPPRRRHPFTRLAGLTAIALATSMGLAACAAPAPESGDKNLTIWFDTQEASTESWNRWKEFNVEPFTAQHADISMEAIRVPTDTFDQKMRVALAAGQGPDLISTGGPTVAVSYAQAGYLADLTQAAEQHQWADQILPWALSVGVVDGKLVALPSSYETLVLYYNKTLFDQHGWTVPTDRPSLEALAEQAIAADVIPFAAGNASWQAATEWHVSAYLNQVAGPDRMAQALNGTLPWTDAAFEASIQMMKDDFTAGWYAGGVRQYFTTEDPQRYAALADGKAAMMVSGSWELTVLSDYFETDANPNRWDWAPLPGLAPGQAREIFPLAVGDTYSANAASPNLEAAVEYLAWRYSDTEAMWAATEAIAQLPLPVRFEASDVPAGVDARFASHYLALNQASSGEGTIGYVSWTSFGPKLGAYVVDNADKVLNGDLSVGDFTAGMASAHQGDEADGAVPPVFTTGA